jgi:hypothetical protein
LESSTQLEMSRDSILSTGYAKSGVSANYRFGNLLQE